MICPIRQADPLKRFLRRQESCYARALRKIEDGKKGSHWMWYVFPQLRGLSKSRKGFVFSLADKNEAMAYLAHPVLGRRLEECCEALLRQEHRTAEEIFGKTDAAKLRSSMTLFMTVSEGFLFQQVLERFFDGTGDPLTAFLLKTQEVCTKKTKNDPQGSL